MNICSGRYEQIGAGTLFETKNAELVPGMQSRVGLHKGIRVTTQNNNPKALLVVEMKVS